VRTVVVYPAGASIPSSDKPKNAPEEPPQEIGPNSYNPQDKLTYKKAPTIDFGSSKYKRKLFEPTIGVDNTLPAYDIPGPGAYTSGDPVAKAKGTSSFVSRSKKPYQAEVSVEKMTPGPGAYEAGYGLSDKVPYNYNPIYERSVPRRDEWRNDYQAPFTAPFREAVPPVGAYNPSTDLESSKRRVLSNDAQTRKKQPGFNSSQSKEYSFKELSPGPSHYKPTQQAPVAFSRPIGGLTPRVSNFDTIKEVPGPGTYDIKKVRPILSKHSVFKSTTKRFDKTLAAGEDVSLPLDDWKPHTNRSADFGYYHSQLSFDSRAPRKNDVFHTPHEGPGPGQYAPTISTPGGPKFDHAKRFDNFGTYLQKPATTDNVGPGAYASEESFVKKSFNSVIETSNLPAE
jgi:hypothetical protein